MGRFIRHIPCPHCGSKDAGGEYEDGSKYCHKCHRSWDQKGKPRLTNEATQGQLKTISGGSYAPLTARNITEETCKKWGYQVGEYRGTPCQIANYKDKDGSIVAQKLRFADKSFKFLGTPQQAGLYGQWMWKAGRGKLVIVEGEIDALTVSQTQNHKWAVVSVPNGAQGAAKAVSKEIEWVESFSEVILMFDQDEPGQAASLEVAQMLSPGKAKIACLPFKDANECLVKGKGSAVIESIFLAKEWRPDEIVAGTDIWEGIVSYDPEANTISSPWETLNKELMGLRIGEILTLAAGSGIGKSTICRELCHHLLVTEKQTIGYIALEESVEISARGIMSVQLEAPLHLKNSVADDKLREAYEATIGSGRWFGYRHFGSMEADNLFSRIRYLVRGCGCQWVFLDHLSIVVSGIEDGDERRTIDNIMTRLRSLTEELGFGLILVSHLKGPEGKPLEEGGMTHLNLLRGSRAIGQLSDKVLGFERNQQDEEQKHITTIRCLKDRVTGFTGVLGKLQYCRETHRLKEINEEQELLEASERSGDF